MKIISWNINNFCKEEDWEKLKNNNLLNKTKKKNKKDINNLIESYYREIENGGILILQEFPYGDNGKEADKFKLNLDVEILKDSKGNFLQRRIYPNRFAYK